MEEFVLKLFLYGKYGIYGLFVFKFRLWVYLGWILGEIMEIICVWGVGGYGYRLIGYDFLVLVFFLVRCYWFYEGVGI